MRTKKPTYIDQFYLSGWNAGTADVAFALTYPHQRLRVLSAARISSAATFNSGWEHYAGMRHAGYADAVLAAFGEAL